MTNGGGAIAAGAAGGVAAAAIIAAEEAAESRRKSHLGADQILIETTLPKATVLKKIADLWANIYVKNDYSLYRKRPYHFNFEAVFVGMLVSVIGIFMIFFLFWMIPMNFKPFILDVYQGIGLVVGFGVVSGIVFGTDPEIEWVSVTTENRKTLVLLKVYDPSGYRNLDEDEIYRIKKAISGEEIHGRSV